MKVFIATGRVAHVLDEAIPLLPGIDPERAPALCNYQPLWPGIWLGRNGDSSDANALPLCRTCEALMGALHVPAT